MWTYNTADGGFYNDAIHDPMPGADVLVALPDEAYAALIAGQAAGKQIALVNGQPSLVEPAVRTGDALVAANTRIRTGRMTVAGTAMAPLQDAVDLGVAKPQEIQLLDAWKTYRVELMRLDMTASPVAWPITPQ